jgi:uncharacterized protein YegP (UPF0339 family)
MKTEVYRAESGQWSFVVFDKDGIDIVRGAGYATRSEAEEASKNATDGYLDAIE